MIYGADGRPVRDSDQRINEHLRDFMRRACRQFGEEHQRQMQAIRSRLVDIEGNYLNPGEAMLGKTIVIRRPQRHAV